MKETTPEVATVALNVSDRDQIVAFLENVVVPSSVGYNMITIAKLLKDLK